MKTKEKKYSVTTEKILKAFPDTKRPHHIVPKGFNDYCDDVGFLYRYSHWTDIPPEDLNYNRDCLAILTDIGLLYVIPAYLKLLAEGRAGEYEGDVIENLCFVLESKGNGKLSFTKEQLEVIDEVLLQDREAESHWLVALELAILQTIRRNYYK